MKAKKPKKMTTKELIELANEVKRGMTKKFLKDMERIRKTDKLMTKKTISKNEAIMIADKVKSGMSIKVMEDLEELKKARSKVLMAEQS
ncbi:hypothetical protein HY637_01320 [Candidatus Woesearchaeota archaeon]|nr:hypothetical protein [Candidatus Woesearchaeota archaeon]